VKKVSANVEQEAKPRRRGRPPSDISPVPNAERQRAHRLRLKDEGKQVLHLALYPDVVHRLDLLRDEGASREDVVERLINTASRKKTGTRRK
jgi:hypothetical protein